MNKEKAHNTVYHVIRQKVNWQESAMLLEWQLMHNLTLSN
jgi:hypothetical protein